jgi:hypothetical protein
MLKLTFNDGYRMANCTMHGEPGTAAAFRHGESGARRRQGALVRGAWPLPLDGDERTREFNRREFSVMCNGCIRRIVNTRIVFSAFDLLHLNGQVCAGIPSRNVTRFSGSWSRPDAAAVRLSKRASALL